MGGSFCNPFLFWPLIERRDPVRSTLKMFHTTWRIKYSYLHVFLLTNRLFSLHQAGLFPLTVRTTRPRKSCYYFVQISNSWRKNARVGCDSYPSPTTVCLFTSYELWVLPLDYRVPTQLPLYNYGVSSVFFLTFYLFWIWFQFSSKALQFWIYKFNAIRQCSR